MPVQVFDLETLQFILEQYNTNVAGECSKLLEKLLKSESNLHKTLNHQDKNVFSSVQVLLGLFQKLNTSNNVIETELPVGLITNNIKQVFHCSNLPDNIVQSCILSIVSSLFKNINLQTSQENLKELSHFYMDILSSFGTTHECQSDCLIFKLKIMNSIYNALTENELSTINKFRENIKLINDLDECELFAKLILHRNDNVAIQTLMYLIPEYINCFKNERIIEVTWKVISKTLTNKEEMRVLIVLCNFFDICFDKSKAKDKTDLTKLLLEDVKYWKLVQRALVETDLLMRKQGMFLLKKTVDLLKNTGRNFICNANNNIFCWDSDCKDELYNIYKDIIICLEFLEEQQVHIIKPVFKMIETLGKKIIECNKVNYSWVVLLYKKALMHESTQIVKWGLCNLLKLPINFFSSEYITGEVAVLLVDTLNSMSIYYNNGLAISQELNDFFKKLNNSKLFFRLFIKQICSQVWSAEALFFVIHSLSGVEEFSCWGEEEISEIGMFVSTAFKTHNKIIRTGVQCELLSAITKLTDIEKVPLECVTGLISKFCAKEVADSPAWYEFTNWLRNSYTTKQAECVLEKYKKKEVGINSNEKFLSLMLILFHTVFYSNSQSSPPLNYLYDILSSFREIDKRPYCDKIIHDQYLSVVFHICEINIYDFNTDLVKSTIPFIGDLLLYIHTQLQQISKLQDFNACEFYLKSFQLIVETLILFETKKETILDLKDVHESLLNSCRLNFIINHYSDILGTILKESEISFTQNSGIPPIGIYWRIKVLYIILKVCPVGQKPHFLVSYLLREVNQPLRKDGDDSKQTRDLQTLWGRMNSQFIEGKWKILEHLCTNKPKGVDGSCWIENETLVKLCLEALNSGGYGVLCPVMSILQDVLPDLEVGSEVKRVVDSVWKLIMERRKTEEFKLLIKHFVKLLYQEKFIMKGTSAQEILFEFADLIFSDSSVAIVNIFMKHIQQLNILSCFPLICHILGKGLMFGPVLKKDDRLTNQVCQHSEFFNTCVPKKMGDYNTCCEIRARAVETILRLESRFQDHQTAAKCLIETLLKMETEINKSRNRYFGNSHVHRVKHRLMQSLLLLEPMLNPNEDEAKELCSWVYHSLMTENSQPSVRYLQEWLLVRMLLRHSDFYSEYCITNYNKDFEENNKRSLCSAIAVSYHLCKLSPSSVLEERIAITLNEIFSFCFHQHFEVRLYSQVVFHKLYDFASWRKLNKVVEKFEFIYMSLGKIFEKHLKGNFGKNLEKMLEDFYFTKFNALEHYSLETIYMDLPRLTNVDSDEWISVEMFESSNQNSTKIRIPLNNDDSLNEYYSNDKCNPSEITSQGENPEESLENYQKKIIPQKPLIPGWDENSDNIKKGGLVVVASLIDRIPNLGGLARTCEIFGASEYVVGSLKYTEDKQFKSLSVTAEKWITLKEVKAQNLLEYIFEMKQKGYTVIGAEQMLHSVALGSAKFPKKSLLLLGNEKEGIPPNLLPLLDICIEIPQLGIIRSLNVHVTGALFIWEYAKQNHFS